MGTASRSARQFILSRGYSVLRRTSTGVALTVLYEATNGPGWAFSDGWLDVDVSLDRWYGVQTDSIGRVVSLDLNSNGLSGSVPEALGRLANMKKLKIGNNALTGRLPLSLSDRSTG